MVAKTWRFTRKNRGAAWSIFLVLLVALFLGAFCFTASSQAQAAKAKEDPAEAEIAGQEIKNAPLHGAAGDGDLEQVKKLLETADVNGRDSLGSTPLMFAASKGQLDVVTILIDKKADVNAKNSDGLTALMFASMEGSLPVVKLLLEKGAEPEMNAPDKIGKNALSYAKTEGRKEVADLLSSKGAKLPPDMTLMRGDHRRCHRVPVCARWRHGHCREWVYVVKCHGHHRHHGDWN